MQITHLGHSTVLIETRGKRILIDPGNFSDAWHALRDLDAIVVTHQHPDHVDPDHVGALIEANPNARVLVEPSVVDAVSLDRAEAFDPDTTEECGEVLIHSVGGAHAVIHRDIPQIGNIGVVIRSDDEPSFFHPGDSLATVPTGIDVVAIPAYGPWAAMKETVDFVRDVAAPEGFLIHDGLINERGWALIFNRMNAMTDTAVHDHRDQVAWQPLALS